MKRSCLRKLAAGCLLACIWPGTAHAQPPMPQHKVAEAERAREKLNFDARDAIMRAITYFAVPERVPDQDAVLIHAYLKDRFGLPRLCAAKQVIAEIKNAPESGLARFLPLAEAVPFKPEYLQLQGEGFDNITLAGIWYDKLQKPSILEERILASPLHESYMATHALWAMAMAKHCFQAKLDTTLEQRLVDDVKKLMERTDVRWNDESIEALAIAQYHDPTYEPPASYIQEIVALQNPDGSWSWNPGNEAQGNQHTTVLALWALLQYKPLAWPVSPRNMVLR